MSVGVGVVRRGILSTPIHIHTLLEADIVGRTREWPLSLSLSLSPFNNDDYDVDVDDDDDDDDDHDHDHDYDYDDGGRCVWGRFARKIALCSGAQSRGTRRGVRSFRRGVRRSVTCVRASVRADKRDNVPICAFRAGVVRTMRACR